MQLVFGQHKMSPFYAQYLILPRPKKFGFPVSRPNPAFGRRNPNPKHFCWIMLIEIINNTSLEWAS
jgi:hypothetical protein